MVPVSALKIQCSGSSGSGEFIWDSALSLPSGDPRAWLPFPVFFRSLPGTNVVKAGSAAPIAPRNSFVDAGDVLGAVTEPEQTLPGYKTYDPRPVTSKAVTPLGPAIVFHGCLQHWNHGIWVGKDITAIH